MAGELHHEQPGNEQPQQPPVRRRRHFAAGTIPPPLKDKQAPASSQHDAGTEEELEAQQEADRIRQEKEDAEHLAELNRQASEKGKAALEAHAAQDAARFKKIRDGLAPDATEDAHEVDPKDEARWREAYAALAEDVTEDAQLLDPKYEDFKIAFEKSKKEGNANSGGPMSARRVAEEFDRNIQAPGTAMSGQTLESFKNPPPIPSVKKPWWKRLFGQK